MMTSLSRNLSSPIVMASEKTHQPTSRDDLAAEYLGQLPFEPYPVQEEALLAWFTAEQGVLVCAPTGTGKTLIAEAAVFEALHTGQRAYYTTPLIALTEQKFHELQQRVVQWGFSPGDVGLVTGNRRENPDAPVLVVVAEILLNRLLAKNEFHFDDVQSVVMDEFHSFSDVERGVVWELSLGMLPSHVRTLLLSATVGNAYEFRSWLKRAHDRTLELVESQDRKVPLHFEWVGDQLLSEHLIAIAKGDEDTRRTPALVFCFNREECWTVAEQLKGKKLIDDGRQTLLAYELKQHDWSQGVGPKLRQILLRGVGVHHAGVLPKYRRIVEALFQEKLLSVCICTETLAAGINLPARSVILPTLMKGPPDNKQLIEASAAHQMFGRAGRPQFDDRGYVYALAHEDDVKLDRWRARYDQIPDNAKDPGLRQAKKQMKKKMPKRRANVKYWTEQQFEKLCTAPAGKLYSKGRLPWRLLAHMLEISPEVTTLRETVATRLMDTGRVASGQKQLDRMLLTLWRAGYVTLEPPPPADARTESDVESGAKPPGEPATASLFGQAFPNGNANPAIQAESEDQSESKPGYAPRLARPTDTLEKLSRFRSVNPLYGVFLINQLGAADRDELLQAMESVLEVPGSVARFVRVPSLDELPPGALASGRLDEQLLRLGLATAEELTGDFEDEAFDPYEQRRRWPLTFAEKLRLLFDYDYPGVEGVFTRPVWIAGELLQFGGNFDKLVISKRLQKQEGIIFRHLLRLILLIGEFASMTPADTTEEESCAELHGIRAVLIESCQAVDPSSTQKALEEASAAGEL